MKYLNVEWLMERSCMYAKSSILDMLVKAASNQNIFSLVLSHAKHYDILQILISNIVPL